MSVSLSALGNQPLLAVLLGAFAASLVVTGAVRALAHRMDLLDRPGAHKGHAEATPTLGGLGVFGGFLLALLASDLLTPGVRAFLYGGSFIVLVGLMDDARGVGAIVKLGALAAATALLLDGGVYLRAFALPMPLAFAMTFLWMGLVASAFNGVDNADGAASGLAAISSFFAFCIAWATWQTELALVALALGGACAGFLWWNYPAPRARIFLGDSGSFFIGFCLAAMIVLGEWAGSGLKAVLMGVTLLAVPLFDFGLILVLRGLHGKYRTLADPITMCARDHTHHRLVALGLSPREALLAMYAAAVLTGSCAVAMAGMGRNSAMVLFLALAGLGLAAAAWLNGAQVDEDSPATAPGHLPRAVKAVAP